MHDLAVFVIVGTKFKVFHVTKHPRIPTMDEAPPKPALDLEECRNRDMYKKPWEGTDISVTDIQAQLQFGPVDAMTRRGQGRALDEDPEKMQPQPFDTQNEADRHAIDASLVWTQGLANSRGEQYWERFESPHPYEI